MSQQQKPQMHYNSIPIISQQNYGQNDNQNSQQSYNKPIIGEKSINDIDDYEIGQYDLMNNRMSAFQISNHQRYKQNYDISQNCNSLPRVLRSNSKNHINNTTQSLLSQSFKDQQPSLKKLLQAKHFNPLDNSAVNRTLNNLLSQPLRLNNEYLTQKQIKQDEKTKSLFQEYAYKDNWMRLSRGLSNFRVTQKMTEMRVPPPPKVKVKRVVQPPPPLDESTFEGLLCKIQNLTDNILDVTLPQDLKDQKQQDEEQNMTDNLKNAWRAQRRMKEKDLFSGDKSNTNLNTLNSDNQTTNRKDTSASRMIMMDSISNQNLDNKEIINLKIDTAIQNQQDQDFEGIQVSNKKKNRRKIMTALNKRMTPSESRMQSANRQIFVQNNRRIKNRSQTQTKFLQLQQNGSVAQQLGINSRASNINFYQTAQSQTQKLNQSLNQTAASSSIYRQILQNNTQSPGSQERLQNYLRYHNQGFKKFIQDSGSQQTTGFKKSQNNTSIFHKNRSLNSQLLQRQVLSNQPHANYSPTEIYVKRRLAPTKPNNFEQNFLKGNLQDISQMDKSMSIQKDFNQLDNSVNFVKSQHGQFYYEGMQAILAQDEEVIQTLEDQDRNNDQSLVRLHGQINNLHEQEYQDNNPLSYSVTQPKSIINSRYELRANSRANGTRSGQAMVINNQDENSNINQTLEQNISISGISNFQIQNGQLIDKHRSIFDQSQTTNNNQNINQIDRQSTNGYNVKSQLNRSVTHSQHSGSNRIQVKSNLGQTGSKFLNNMELKVYKNKLNKSKQDTLRDSEQTINPQHNQSNDTKVQKRNQQINPMKTIDSQDQKPESLIDNSFVKPIHYKRNSLTSQPSIKNKFSNQDLVHDDEFFTYTGNNHPKDQIKIYKQVQEEKDSKEGISFEKRRSSPQKQASMKLHSVENHQNRSLSKQNSLVINESPKKTPYFNIDFKYLRVSIYNKIILKHSL